MRRNIRFDHLAHRPSMHGREIYVYPDGPGWSLLEISEGGGSQWLEQASKPLCLYFARKAVRLGAELAIVNTPYGMFEHAGIAEAFR